MINKLSFTQRAELLVNDAVMEKIKRTKVLLFGVGGVGSFCAEALIRSGFEHLSLVDFDRIELSNLNRQLMTHQQNISQLKVEVLKERLLNINPNAKIDIYPIYFDSEEQLDFSKYDAVFDAIDSSKSKLLIAKLAQKHDLFHVMALGTARKLNPSLVIETSLFKTSGDPLARIMRASLKKHQLKDCRVVTSTEPALPSTLDEERQSIVNGSMIFVPATAGLKMAAMLVEHLRTL